MNGDIGTSTQAPQLRALLFTDLCDSVVLVERIGDTAAAELFQQHDRLVLTLQQQWNGHQIDRSDGLFLLFERTIDGLGFALDYQRGLQQLGRERGVELRARAGLHVGEVLTWENSAEAIKAGAKSLEVEGLAKPMAARLMTLARPGQILLSAVAESLTRRATSELGERADRLVWKSHGRWRFKGIPTTQEVIEVGEVGFTPLRMPRATAKARRDIPLWRQPAALAAEVAVAAMLAVGGWVLLRPEPAIAFAERDWVVMADMQNLTGNALLDDSLQQAFRISLEQSRYVNVISEMKARETLSRMRVAARARIDRNLASEVALRDGARAVILPSVAEIGGRLRISIEVIDPSNQSTIYVLARDARSLDGLLASVDNVTVGLRDRLGESEDAIRQASEALPDVTTDNLDALKIYAIGIKAYSERRLDDARALFQKAVEVDPEFALAYAGIMRTYVSQAEADRGEPYLRKAASLRSHLPTRDRLYIDAWTAEFEPHPSRNAPEKWRVLAQIYPDVIGAQHNYAWAEYLIGNLDASFLAAGRVAASKEPLRYVGRDLVGRIHLTRGEFGHAKAAFTDAERISGSLPGRRHAAALAAQGETEAALAILQKRGREEPGDPLLHIEWTAALMDARRAEAAVKVARDGLALTGTTPNVVISGPLRIGELAARFGTAAPPSRRELQVLTEEMLHAAEHAGAGERDDLVGIALASARLSQRFAQQPVLPETMKRLEQVVVLSGHSRSMAMMAVVHADQWRLAGQPARAIEQLRPLDKATDIVQWHVAMRDAMTAAGDSQGAAAQTRWLSRHRGKAYADPVGAQAFVVMNVVDVPLAEASAATSG
ncbi:putative peptide modification system cyclase [Stenotrophomonas sp.]|uniref:putative peptide modification system cyclase n=1 Tax=Stenotrophomonas sp. TaxID=69392 RepID=UPI0028B25C65|nr:putative peptide modification system cyclase [Stenotrophomonas sp.]